MTTSQGPLKVLYFAVRYDFYPRNRRIRAYLENEYSAEITIVPALIGGNPLVRYVRQLLLAVRAGRGHDLVVLAEFNLHYFAFSWLAAKLNRAPHLVDFFVGKYESAVQDRATYRADSLRARLLRLVDRFAILSSSSCVTDTEPRARNFAALAGGSRAFRVLPVGAPAWAYPRGARDAGPSEPVRLLYYGNYIPLHGLDALLDALPAVQHDVRLTMIGNGSRREGIEKRVRELGWSDRVSFRDHISETDLAEVISDHDVVIGIFGSSSKAATVIANKVWQGLYMGRVVLTRSSAALADIAGICGDALIQAEDVTPSGLAAAVDRAAAASQEHGRPETDIAGDLERYVSDRFDEAFLAIVGPKPS